MQTRASLLCWIYVSSAQFMEDRRFLSLHSRDYWTKSYLCCVRSLNGRSPLTSMILGISEERQLDQNHTNGLLWIPTTYKFFHLKRWGFRQRWWRPEFSSEVCGMDPSISAPLNRGISRLLIHHQPCRGA